MAAKEHDGIFSLTDKKPRTKADITDAAVREILREESEERAAQSDRLRKARLARDAETKADTAKPSKPKRAPARK
ncbi:hypothetical protein [Hyphobacterium sp.]|uniref:hypothetical protein n=1 Tax=Hyphobacterium sp. TaxID=2004662 RepID=UPI003B51D54E